MVNLVFSTEELPVNSIYNGVVLIEGTPIRFYDLMGLEGYNIHQITTMLNSAYEKWNAEKWKLWKKATFRDNLYLDVNEEKMMHILPAMKRLGVGKYAVDESKKMLIEYRLEKDISDVLYNALKNGDYGDKGTPTAPAVATPSTPTSEIPTKPTNILPDFIETTPNTTSPSVPDYAESKPSKKPVVQRKKYFKHQLEKKRQTGRY